VTRPSSTASDGADFTVVAGGAMLALAVAAGTLLLTKRHRRVALP
jgi:transketolase C-terminal domain/subunit